jgi:alpha-L-rhamnosidase
VKDGLVGKRLTQGGQAFALRYGLVSGQEREVAAKLLVDAVKARGTALSTGQQCTNFLLEELSAAGAWDTVAGVVAREEFPGWLYMERQGATTLWERWPDPKPIHSFNHPMFGHVDAWMKKHILGVRLAPDAVGGDKVIIDPKPLCGVKWAKGSLTVATGTIHVEWSLRPDGSVDLDYTLPHGTERVEK